MSIQSWVYVNNNDVTGVCVLQVKAGAVDATTARLTDASGYTGSHKERFDADGKGKGIDGRVDK